MPFLISNLSYILTFCLLFPQKYVFSRFGDFDDKILYLCTVYLTHINLTAVTL